jgi:uncharacterized protein (UPF0332 family)
MVLCQWSLFNACANRAYYEAFQAAVAVLAHFKLIQVKRIEHRAIQGLFNSELVHKRKIFPNHLKSCLSVLQDLRDIADYEGQMVSKSKATVQLRLAKEFIDSILQEINK